MDKQTFIRWFTQESWVKNDIGGLKERRNPIEQAVAVWDKISELIKPTEKPAEKKKNERAERYNKKRGF